MLGLSLLLTLVPSRLSDVLAARIARLYTRKHSRHRELAVANLKACFPLLDVAERESLLQEYFVSLFQVLMHTPKMWWWPRKSVHSSIVLQGAEEVDTLLEQNKSVIFLVSHSIALDFGLIGLARKYPLHGIYKPFSDPVVDWVVKRSRQRFGGITVARDAGLRGIIREQQNGKCLVYLGDEDLGLKGSVFAPFFAARKATLTMLPRIARKVDAALVPVFSHYDASQQRFVVTILPVVEDYPVDDDVENATKMNQAIERSVAVCQAQYFWKLKYFKTWEDGAADIYARSSTES